MSSSTEVRPGATGRPGLPSLADPAVRSKLILVAVLILALATPPTYLDDSWLTILQYIMIGAVGAIGLTLLTGQAGQLSLAHPFFLFVGAVTYCVISSEENPAKPDLIAFGLPPIFGLIGGIAMAGLLGVVFAPVAGRVRGVYLGVATLALVYVGLYLGQRYSDFSGGTASGREPADFALFGQSFVETEKRQYFLFLIFTLVAYALAVGAVKSRPGRSWRAVRDNEHAASALGVPVTRVRAEVFAISSAYAGLAGVMFAFWADIVKPDESEFAGSYSIPVAIAFLAMILIGGLGSVGGAVAGAVIVFGMPLMLPKFFGSNELIGSGATAVTPIILTTFLYGALVIAVVMFEPGGLAAIGRRFMAWLSRTPVGALLAPSKGL
ncbi:MAG: branched-chain amino acid ABC transporter permease [Sporichthyaceae bacterium]